MANKFDEMREAVKEASTTLRAADESANAMAILISSRLKHVNVYTLIKLKRELRDFDMHKKEWKS